MFCIMCGAPKTTPYCTACGSDSNGVPGDIDSLVRRPNWGAFFLPGLWPFWHGSVWTGIAWWICLGSTVVAPAIGGILAFTIAAYLLIWGNHLALSRRRFRDAAEFVRVERYWARWGLGIFVAGAAVAGAAYLDAPDAGAATLR
jgi:hypothetical protein